MSHDVTPPPMPGFPPQPPPRKSGTGTAVIASAAAVLAAIVGAGVTYGVTGGDSEAKPAPTVTVTETAEAGGADGAEADPAAGDGSADGSHSLTDTVTHEHGVEVGLSGFSRATSDENGFPENTPYAKFAVRIANGSKAAVDPSEISIACAYGDEGREADSVFAEDLDGPPTTRVLAGRSLTFTWGCALPKDETFLQIEVTTDWESEPAVFTGEVK